MKKSIAYILSTVLIFTVMIGVGLRNNVDTVAETQKATENPGDIVDNPWSDLFEDKDNNGDLPLDVTTASNNNVTSKDSTNSSAKKIGKVTIKKVYTKKITSNKLKVKIKKVSGVKGYQIAVYKTSKNAKKNKKPLIKKYVKKTNITIKSSKLKNKKKLYVKVRAYKTSGSRKSYGAWSKTKKVNIKK